MGHSGLADCGLEEESREGSVGPDPDLADTGHLPRGSLKTPAATWRVGQCCSRGNVDRCHSSAGPAWGWGGGPRGCALSRQGLGCPQQFKPSGAEKSHPTHGQRRPSPVDTY